MKKVQRFCDRQFDGQYSRRWLNDLVLSLISLMINIHWRSEDGLRSD